MKDTDQDRKSRTGGDIEPYDEVVTRDGGIRNQGFYDKPFQSSADDNQAGRSTGGISGGIFLRKALFIFFSFDFQFYFIFRGQLRRTIVRTFEKKSFTRSEGGA